MTHVGLRMLCAALHVFDYFCSLCDSFSLFWSCSRCEHWDGGGMMLRGAPLPGIIDYYAKVFFGSF